MKKLVILLLCLILTFGFTACKTEKQNENHTPITVNMPTDDSVNGYKSEYFSAKIEEKTITENNNDNKTQYKYFGNLNSKKFHLTSCSAFGETKAENKVFYKTKEEFLQKGYIPCKMCNP